MCEGSQVAVGSSFNDAGEPETKTEPNVIGHIKNIEVLKNVIYTQ
jgi:hypothetical protein